MNKNILLVAAFSCFAAFGFAQIKVVAPNGDTGIGTDSPTEKLEVDGNIQIPSQADFLAYRSDGVTKHSLMKLDALDDFVMNQSALTAYGNQPAGAKFAIGNSRVFAVLDASNTSMFRVIENSGNIAIGFNGTSDKLRVNGVVSATAFNVSSDKRLKKNVSNYKKGLDAVLKLNPITFEYNNVADIKDNDAKHIGLFAQNLEEVAPEMVSEFTTYSLDDNGRAVAEEEYLQIKDNEVKYLLINAIKEQQEIIEELEMKLETLTQLVSDNQIDETNQQVIELSDLSESALGQNRPNPFQGKTVIDYKVTKDAKNCKIVFYNSSGRVISEMVLDKNETQLVVDGNELPSGVYSYKMIVDDVVVGQEKMIVTK